MNGEQRAKYFNRNLSVIGAQTEGLSHPDSLIQFPFQSNCLNWTLGHLVVNRDDVLEILGEPRLFKDEETQRYQYGSEPVIDDGPNIVSMERMLRLLAEAQVFINAKLPVMSSDDLDRQIQRGERTVTVAKRLEFLYWHETYHTGQTEILRQLAGADDKVI